MIFLKKLAKKVQIEKLACDLLTDFYILIIFSTLKTSVFYIIMNINFLWFKVSSWYWKQYLIFRNSEKI